MQKDKATTRCSEAEPASPTAPSVATIERALIVELTDAAYSALCESNGDPRDPDPTREGIFRDHNCFKCRNGHLPCVRGNNRSCDFLHARND